MRLLVAQASVALMLAFSFSAAHAEGPKVQQERPRVFWRAGEWDGPSIARIKGWMDQPEYKDRLSKLTRKEMRDQAGGSAPVNDALLFLLKDDQAAGKLAVEGLKKFRISGESPSYSGIEAQKMAALYDWLHDHPDLDADSRKACAAHMEKWADGYYQSLKSGGPSTPFYSRVSGALGGLTALGLALQGDSPKADTYVAFAAEYLKTRLGTIRQQEDGATGGGSYGYHHEFTDLANIVAAWRSATDWDAGKWIKESQGNWLERQMLFQIWHTYPNGWFVKDGDIWGGSHTDKTQFTMQFGPIAGMYGNGFGRTHMAEAYKRWRLSDYHAQFIWEWFVFNDPRIKPAPLEGLGRAEVFSPKLHGFVCWRSGWGDDATIVHFKCGEAVDHHGTYDQGKFLIFKQTPLAIKSGAYVGYKTPHHMFYKSPWSANCVVFTGAKWDGQQPHIDFDGTPSWEEWKTARDKNVNRPPTGVLLTAEANEKFARAVGDLSGSCPPGTTWIREIVFLGYKHVVVLDRVKAAADIKHRWTLHTVNQPKIDGMTVTADNAPGRLFCRTLLPAKAKLSLVGGEGHEFDYNGENRLPKGYKGLAKEAAPTQYGEWRLDVEPADGAAECVYLHVLDAADEKTELPAELKDCAVQQTGGDVTVKVGELSHTFKGNASK